MSDTVAERDVNDVVNDDAEVAGPDGEETAETTETEGEAGESAE